MNTDAWVAVAAVAVALVALAWQMHRDNRSDRARQLEAAVEKAREQGDMKGRVDALESDVIDHEKRLRRLELGDE